MGVQITPWEGTFFFGGGKQATHCIVQGCCAMSCANSAKTIEMPIGMVSWIELRNYVLDEASSHTCHGWVVKFGRYVDRTKY